MSNNGFNETQEEIYNALHTLQDLCIILNSNCRQCPLGTDTGDCLLHKSDPDNYKITDRVPWRALE